MTEGRKIAAILVADIAGYSRLMGTDEEGTLDRLRALRSELFMPTIEAHGGRVVNRTGDGAVIEFKSVVEAVRSALEIARGLSQRNAPLPPERRIEVRIGIHLGDVIETQDGDLYGDAVNIAARLEAVCAPGGVCLSEDAWRQVRDKMKETFVDLGEHELKNIVRPMRVYALELTAAAPSPTAVDGTAPSETRPAQRFSTAIEALERAGRLTDAYVDEADALREAAKRLSHDHGRRRGLAKAAEVLATVERIVDAVADRKARAGPPDTQPPEPLGRETEGAKRARLRHRRWRDPGDAGAS